MGKANGRQTEMESRRLDDLIPFPSQEDVFAECSPEEDRVLAEDIKQNGLKYPIEILPNNEAGYKPNTILKGHRRLRALISLGHEEYDVCVRYDLASSKNATTIEREFVNDNLNRRQLSKLGQARAVLRLFELEKGRDRDALGYDEQRAARDRVGKQIDMSGRNLQRYMNILKLPFLLQQAVECESVSLQLGDKASRLPDDIQQRIAKKIRDGGDPKQAMLNYVGAASRHRELPAIDGKVVTATIKKLRQLNEDLRQFDVSGFKKPPKKGHLEVLRETRRNCDELVKALQANAKRGH